MVAITQDKHFPTLTIYDKSFRNGASDKAAEINSFVNSVWNDITPANKETLRKSWSKTKAKKEKTD